MTESQEPESNDEPEEEDGQLTDRDARSVLPPPGADVPLGPDELPPIKPA